VCGSRPCNAGTCCSPISQSSACAGHPCGYAASDGCGGTYYCVAPCGPGKSCDTTVTPPACVCSTC
jgi:hypothetical protein